MIEPAYSVEELSARRSRFAVVVPVINEGKRLHSLLAKMIDLNIQEEFDVIITDGGSTDGSVDVETLKKFSVSALVVKKGPGKLGTQLQAAYHFGIQQGYEGIITIDGNDKDEPSGIFTIREKLSSGYDFVQASRFIKGGKHENTPLSRLFAIRAIHAPLLSLASGFRWTDTTQGFRGYSKSLLVDQKLDLFNPELYDYKFLFYLSFAAPKLGFRCTEVPTSRIYPATGETPTKIKGILGNYLVLKSLLAVCMGNFGPKRV